MTFFVHDPSYMTLSSQEKHLFLLFSYFRAHPTTLLLKILGGRMHGPFPPPQTLGGTVLPVPLGFRLWLDLAIHGCMIFLNKKPLGYFMQPSLGFSMDDVSLHCVL